MTQHMAVSSRPQWQGSASLNNHLKGSDLNEFKAEARDRALILAIQTCVGMKETIPEQIVPLAREIYQFQNGQDPILDLHIEGTNVIQFQ